MRRFASMRLHVASLLVENVQYFASSMIPPTIHRIGARKFGVWFRDLPTLLGSLQLSTHTVRIHIPVFPPRRLFLVIRSPPLRLPVARFPDRPPLPAVRPAGHLLSFVSSLKAPGTVFLITIVPMARFLLRSISCLMRKMRRKSNNRHSKRRMVSGLFLRPSDGSVGVRARA